MVACFLGLGLKQVSYVFGNLPNLAIYQLVCNCRLGPSFCVPVLNYWNLRNNGILLSVCKGRYLIRKHEKLSWLVILMLCSHLTSAFASTSHQYLRCYWHNVKLWRWRKRQVWTGLYLGCPHYQQTSFLYLFPSLLPLLILQKVLSVLVWRKILIQVMFYGFYVQSKLQRLPWLDWLLSSFVSPCPSDFIFVSGPDVCLFLLETRGASDA